METSLHPSPVFGLVHIVPGVLLTNAGSSYVPGIYLPKKSLPLPDSITKEVCTSSKGKKNVIYSPSIKR